MINKGLPKNLPLKEIKEKFNIKIFLDSFNEMPREQIESGAYELDFSTFIGQLDGAPLFIGSRTTDGLTKFDFPTFHLDLIDEKTIDAELKRLNLEISGNFKKEIRSLLQRPFYFQYILSGDIVLPAQAHPRDFYRIFFRNISTKFFAKFNLDWNIERVLSHSAYEALNNGEEAFAVSDFTRIIRSFIPASIESSFALEITNWLISNSILTPYSGARIAFIHQSITEYLAATELADRYLQTPHVLKEKLRLTRWDQAIFLTLSLLSDASADAFFEDVLSSDLTLAATAVKFIEINQSERVSRILEEIGIRSRRLHGLEAFKLSHLVSTVLPFTEDQTIELWKHIERGDLLGGSAVKALVSIKGIEVKNQLLPFLMSRRHDYNLCANGIGPELSPFAQISDIQKLYTAAGEIGISGEEASEKTQGFVSGGAKFLSKLDLSDILRVFTPHTFSESTPPVQIQLICEILRERHTTQALEAAATLLINGVDRASTTIDFIASFSKDQGGLIWSCFNESHVKRFLTIIQQDEDREIWAHKALTHVCRARPDLAGIVRSYAEKSEGLLKAALLLAVSPHDEEQVFSTLQSLTLMNDFAVSAQPLRLLRQFELNWESHGQLFIQLLQLKNKKLTSNLLRSFPANIKGMRKIRLQPIEWWLDWILTMAREGYWEQYTACTFISEYSSIETQEEIVSEFNNPESRFRKILHDHLLPRFTSLSTDDLSPEAISYAFSSISRAGNQDMFQGRLLGQAATESFVHERIIPLLRGASPEFAIELKNILKEAGARHGKRYSLESDE